MSNLQLKIREHNNMIKQYWLILTSELVTHVVGLSHSPSSVLHLAESGLQGGVPTLSFFEGIPHALQLREVCTYTQQ